MGRAPKVDEAVAMELYRRGLNDTEIGKRLNVANTTIYNWRKRHSLRSNYVASNSAKKSDSMSKLVQDVIMSRKAGMNYGMWKANGG